MLKTISKTFQTALDTADHRQCMMMAVGWLDSDVVTVVLFSTFFNDYGIILILSKKIIGRYVV